MYVYVDIQCESWSGNRVTSKYFLRLFFVPPPLSFVHMHTHTPTFTRSFPTINLSRYMNLNVCICVQVSVHALRVVDQRTKVLQELFVSVGYAEHSKVPPKITSVLALQRMRANSNEKFASIKQFRMHGDKKKGRRIKEK